MDMSPALEALLSSLQRDIAELRAENAALKQEVADLKRQLGKDSTNSSKPPSSDGLGRKPRISGSLRGKSGKASGGQFGHKGDTLRTVAEPDHIARHEAFHCVHCRAQLSSWMQAHVERRQVFDMPLPRVEVTEHQACVYVCGGCRGVTKASFPDGVIGHVQYGPRLRAAAVYLNAQQLVPEDRVSDIMKDLFGASLLCPASIVAWGEKKACDLKGLAEDIAALVAQAPVRNLDETGFRIAGLTQWLHTASTPCLTHYRVSGRRGEVPTNLKGGVIVHDHFSPYFKIPNVLHALCNAHHLRELKALIQIDKELWAQNMSNLLAWASKAVRRAASQGEKSLDASTLKSFDQRYEALVDEGIALHTILLPMERPPALRGRQAKRHGHNLAIRLRDFKADVLRFLYDFDVPFTNNLAEQDIRMMKVRMKISGSFRTMQGAQTFATLRTVISTARKQGWGMLETLSKPTQDLQAALKA